MNNEVPKDQTRRKENIAILEATIAKNAAAIHAQELTTRRMIEKQIHRLAELRLQKLLLKRAEDFAAFKAREAAQPATCN